jgi:hypothetical protein
MSSSTSTFRTGTLQAWMRLPKSVRFLCAIVAVAAMSGLFAAAIRTPVPGAAAASAAAPAAPMRDPSVPDAAQALSAEQREQQAWTPTF